MISDEDSPFLIENLKRILRRGNTKVVHDKRKKYVDDVFDLALSNLRSGRGKIEKSPQIDLKGVSNKVRHGESYLECESLTLSNGFSSDVASTTEESERHNKCTFSAKANYDSENSDDEEHFECSPGFRNDEEIRLFNENIKRKFYNDLLDYYNVLKLEHFDESPNCGQSAYPCEDFGLSQDHSGCENSPSVGKNVLDNSPVGAKHVAPGWGGQRKQHNHNIGGKTQHPLLTSDKKCMQRSGASKNNAHGRVTPKSVLSNGMIKRKKEILENAFTKLEDKPTATQDKKFASFLPSCGGIECDSEGGERKSTHKGSNKPNVDSKEAKRGNKGLESCDDLANGKIEAAASSQPTDADKSKYTNGGKALREIIDKGGVAKNGKADREKRGVRRINLNKNHNHLERDASELSRDTPPCDEKRSHVSLQIGGSSRSGRSNLNEERKNGNLPPDGAELDSSETNASLSNELKKDSKMSRKHICKSSTILSRRERPSINQKSSEKIAQEGETSDSSNGLEKRRLFIMHSRKKTVYKGESQKKRLRKNKEKLKKCSMDSFDKGRGNNSTREKKKVDRGKWENKSNSSIFEGDSLEGEILERKKRKGKLPRPKGSEQFLSYVNSRGNKTKVEKYQGSKVSSVESSKSDRDESSSSSHLRPNSEGYRTHGSKGNDEEVLEGRPLEMLTLSMKRFHFYKGEGDEEKLKFCEKHRSGEKVEFDQKGEYIFCDKCREINANMADENLKNGVSEDMMSKSVLVRKQEDHQYARKGEGSNEDNSYVTLEEVSKNGAHNFYLRRSRYTSLRSKSIRLSGVYDWGDHYSGYSEVEEHHHDPNDDKYLFPFCDEMYEDGKFAREVYLPRGDSVLENGNQSSNRSGNDDLYLPFQESTPRGEESIPDELLHSKPPTSNVESEHSDDTQLRRREYIRGQICRILKKENWDGEAESMLNLFFRCVDVEAECSKNSHTLIGEDIKKDKKGVRKGGRGKRGNKTGICKKKQQLADIERGKNGGVDKLERVYLDDAPRSMPLTMLIVRNYEEGHLHHQQERKEGSEKVSVKYKVELTGVKNPMGMKKAVEKEKNLFSRIERIYDFCASDGEECAERWDNNLVDRFIPFPNMGWSCSKEGYQHEVLSIHSALGQEREGVFFDDERENLINEERSHMGGKGLMLGDAFLGVPKKEGTNKANKFVKKSPLAKWNVNVCTKSVKQPGGKNALVKRGPKGVAIHFDGKGSLKYSFRKGVPAVGGRPEGRAIQIGTSKKSPLPRKSSLEGNYPKGKAAKWGKAHHVSNFKDYLKQMRNTRGGNKTEEPLPKDGQKREDSRDTLGGSPSSSSTVNVVDDKNEGKIIGKSFLLPTGVEPEVATPEISNRPKGEPDSYRQLKSSSGHGFKRGGSKKDEDIKLVSDPPRDVLDPLVKAHNGSQKDQPDAVEKKEDKEGEKKRGSSNTFKDSYARKNSQDGDNPRRSFKTDKQNRKSVENGPQSLDGGGSSGKPPRREEKPTSNEKEEGTKTLHAGGRKEEGLRSPPKDGKREKEEKGNYNSRRSEGMVDKLHPNLIDRFYEPSKGSKMGKKESEESALEQEADTLNKEGSPRRILRSIEVASPGKMSFRHKSSLTGGRSISHFLSKHEKEKKQKSDLGPSAENKISRGKNEKAKTAKGLIEKGQYYGFTNLGKNVEQNISPLMEAKEGDPLKSHQRRSPPSVSNKSEIKLTASHHGTRRIFNDPRKEDTHEGNNAKRTTNLVGRRKSSLINRRGKPSPRAMGSFPRKKTLRQMDKPVLKNEKGMARNSNYVDLRNIECSKSTLEFLLEKKYLKRNNPGEGTDGTEGQKKKKKKKKKKKDLSLVCNQSVGRQLSKRFAMSRQENEKKMSNRKIANAKEVPETDQFSNLSYIEGGRGEPPVLWPRKLFIEEEEKKKEEKRVYPPSSASSSEAPSSRRSAATTAGTPAADLTRGVEKREALKLAQIKAAHTSCTLRLNEETKATPFGYNLLRQEKDERKFKRRTSHVHSSKSSLSYRLTNVVRVKRKIYLSDMDVERSPGMDSRGREDVGASFTGEEEETQSERRVVEQIDQIGDNKSDQPTEAHKDNHKNAGKIATTLRKAPAKKAKQIDHFLTIKINIITVFLHSSYVKKINMKASYNIQVTIYSSSDRKTIEQNWRKETFPCYFTSHTSGIGLSSDAFKKIDAMCESETKQFFKLVVSCRREKSFLKKELIRIYSRTFEAPIELKTYSLSKNKKYAFETGSSNDELYEMNGNVGENTRVA
ncbi:Uncharacterized protein PCOAH_00005810 [Plasmodium coatneyi]|uniref:Uncharacterized protein n=1 Tax=Plasmodium coatneyi TaxID=208452 RepID=A0A1B1DTJ2_9APIC|nr:Uncharacterized protein PCOAH_00005810 [Plasmodium coatneyi]ANQ06093.1 Uncharacterized protein PCOAH_00005810 [Plasmodium coatneyi]